MAQDFAEDFDGIVAGAPAVAFNNLTSWSGHFLPITGVAGSKTFVSTDMWSIIHQDILRQCDKLDGYADGIIEDPLLCNYTGTSLLCSANATTNCLTAAQQNTVQQIFSPMYLEDGSFVYPRMQPGSEEVAKYVLYSGGVFPYTADWFKYALYNNASWDPTTISNQDYINAITVNPGDIQSFKGDLSGMRKRGSKILHYHGQMDGIISSEISPLYYNHVKETMGLTECQLDEFYRFFRISGTGHCTGGDGASVFGNTWGSVESNNPAENVLLAIVDWVENKKAPETVIGTRWVDGVKSKGVDYKRAHCKFPKSNKYKGEGDPKAIDSWQCV
jgi:feruloyl esterase